MIDLDKRQNGFTLVELLVVISIISLLSSVVLSSISNARNDARLTAAQRFEGQVNTQLVLEQQLQMPFSGDMKDDWGDYYVEGGVPGWVSYAEDVPYGDGKSLVLPGGNQFRITGDETYNTSKGMKTGINVSESSYTVSFWLKTNQTGEEVYAVRNGGSHDRNITVENNGSICSRIWSVETICSDDQGYADGDWHYVLHTFGSKINGQSLWIDGKRQATGGKQASDYDWQNRITISDTGVSGKLFNLRIYSGTFDGFE